MELKVISPFFVVLPEVVMFRSLFVFTFLSISLVNIACADTEVAAAKLRDLPRAVCIVGGENAQIDVLMSYASVNNELIDFGYQTLAAADAFHYFGSYIDFETWMKREMRRELKEEQDSWNRAYLLKSIRLNNRRVKRKCEAITLIEDCANRPFQDEDRKVERVYRQACLRSLRK